MAKLPYPTRILILDDILSDALLAERELKRYIINFESRIVDSEELFRESLDSFRPDLIISDYQMPSFDGMAALLIAREITPDAPFIVFTGSMNEDTAVSCMRAGAADYVIKEHLKRLGPAAVNALEQKKIRFQKQMALNLLESREEMYRLMFERNPQPMIIYDSETLAILEVNQSAVSLYGYTVEEFLSLTIKDIRPSEDIPALMKVVKMPRGDYHSTQEWRHIKKNGDMIYVEIISHGIIFNNKPARHVLIKDITRQRKSEEALKHSEAKYRAFFENSFDSILLTNPDGSIYEANPAACNMFGYQSDEFSRLKRKDLVDLNDPNLLVLLSVREKTGRAMGELYFVKKDGSTFPAEISSALFEDADKQLRSSMIIRDVTIRKKAEEVLKKSEEILIQDLSEKKRLIEEMAYAKKKAEESDRLKTAFLQNISHEIRTPLNAIVGFCGFLANPNIDMAKRKRFLEIVEASSNQLLTIISGIISMATLEAGQEHLQEKECNLNEILHNVYEQFKITNESPEVDFKYIPALPDKDSYVLIDEVKLVQVLANLISNAFKFTPKGSIRIGYHVNNTWIEFFVSDSGIGISPDMHELIFERFRQVDDSPTRKYGGAGLGLALSKGYVEMMGGRIKVQSEPGKGSLFTFTVPYKPLISPKN